MGNTSQRQISEDSLRRIFYDLESLVEVLGKQAETSEDKALRALNAAQINMAPTVSITVLVSSDTPPLGIAPGPRELIWNVSSNLMQITFTNDDFAIPVYIGNGDVVVPAGDLLEPRQRLTFWLRRGQRKFGIAAAGAVNVIVTRAESALQAVTVDAPTGEIYM
jgi:hypothetical protein